MTILEKKLFTINLNEHPESILKALTEATQAAIDFCFPLKTKSNRAKKRPLMPWYDTEIFKGEKTQQRLFRRFIKTKREIDHQTYKIFRKNCPRKNIRQKRIIFRIYSRKQKIVMIDVLPGM